MLSKHLMMKQLLVMISFENNRLRLSSVSAAVTTGRAAQELEERFHVFSSLIISPQAMLLAPEKSVMNSSNEDLFTALNAAIADVQREGIDETLLKRSEKWDLVRVYTCHQDSQLPVPNKNQTTGILRDILFNNQNLTIGGLGPNDWGVHDGNYMTEPPVGFYPKLLEAIVDKLAKLKGPDGIVYSQKINFQRKYYKTSNLLFQALLNGSIHATDVYLLIEAPYSGTGAVCSDDSTCPIKESCINSTCIHPTRPRSLHFRTTCTTSSRDTKFITKKSSQFGITSVSVVCRILDEDNRRYSI